MDSVLITGASGFIGSHLAGRLTHAGLRVVGTCTGARGAERLRHLPENFSLALADLRVPDSLDALFSAHRFHTVFHLAAHGVHANTDDACAVAAINGLGSFALARAALHHGVERFLYCGSALEYQPSDSPIDEATQVSAPNLYGASKNAGWLLLDFLRRVEGLPLITVRPFTVFGPGESGDKLVPYVIRQALAREPLHLTSGTQVRDYVYVGDVVEALILAARSTSAPGSIFNIGSGPDGARTVRSVVETTLKLIGAPLALCRFGKAGRTRIDPPFLVSDSSRAFSELGWKPSVSLESGLRKTIQWYSAEKKVLVDAA